MEHQKLLQSIGLNKLEDLAAQNPSTVHKRPTTYEPRKDIKTRLMMTFWHLGPTPADKIISMCDIQTTKILLKDMGA